MKFKLLSLLLVAFSLKAFSQSNNTLAVVYGTSSTPVNIHNAVGDYGYNTKTGITAGFMYTRRINKFFSVQTGLLYAHDNVEASYIEPGLGNRYQSGNVNVISIPVHAKLTFFKYFFFDSGLSADLQTNYQKNGAINNQTGLGGELGFGGQLPLGSLLLFVNPYMHQYNLTAINNNLYEFGVKFGAGFRF